MYRFQLYDSEDIQKLKKEIDVYRNILEAMNLDHLYEQLDTLKSNNEILVEKMINLKGDIQKMNEKYELQKTNFENKERNLTEHISTLDTALIELKQDVNIMMNKIDNLQLKDIIAKVDKLMEKQNKDLEVKKEMEEIKTEILQMKEQLKEKEELLKQHTPPQRTSEYRRLQNMLQTQNSVISSNTIQNERNPTRKPSFFSQISSNRQKMIMSYRNQENITDMNDDKKTSHPLGLNKNIITRIKTSHLKNPIESQTIEKQQTSQIKKELEEKVETTNEELQVNETSSIKATQEYEDTKQESKAKVEESIQPEEKKSEENKLEDNKQTTGIKDRREETPEKMSIFSFFRKS